MNSIRRPIPAKETRAKKSMVSRKLFRAIGLGVIGVVVCLPIAGDHFATDSKADPCGMVPPIQMNDAGALARIGLQQTYVFYKDGVESFVIRPGFVGKVEEFGMLIPFPTPPALRKVGDEIFPHIERAIDPPEITVYAGIGLQKNGMVLGAAMQGMRQDNFKLEVNEVRVVNQEAVGMYEVAVLEAGSTAALKGWMHDHQYRFPEGMEACCDDYVQDEWCFVAVKTRVGPKRNVDPRPGMRNANPGLPAGASFDGHVQAMGFRFHTDELVVPMRLSAFNAGELRNIVYILSDGPRKIRAIPEEYVVRQIGGKQLTQNVTELLPIRVVGGTINDIPEYRKQSLPQERNPAPHNGLAKDLFASDLLTAATGTLSHSHEEKEKMLLRIGESLQLRGQEIDQVNYQALAENRKANLTHALADLNEMTLTVVDGDFPREVLGATNLTFAEYSMPSRRNNPESYSVPQHAPRGMDPQGKLYRGDLQALLRKSDQPRSDSSPWTTVTGAVLGLLAGGLIFARSVNRRRSLRLRD
ncbi:MAG: DUF2330 domain-containing protein [Pirellulales bacterium]|nr:DUF2330 domain-containing protein [Pirellulales bacterium]